MSFNLTTVLTEQDKNLIKEYIHTYGTPTHFVGVDNWLQEWGKSKIKLYKLLGNQLIYKVPFCWEKDDSEMYQQIAELYKEEISEKDYDNDNTPYEDWSLVSLFNKVVRTEESIRNHDFVCLAKSEKNCDYTLFLSQIARDIINISILHRNKTTATYKISYKGCKKELQLQKGAKALKALKKIIDYIEPLVESEKGKECYRILLNKFEDIRIRHSMILNDKIVKGNLVFSIHPLDFMTMSDNNSNWQSCMSWVQEGCYRIGTVEMMNSNNVVCCYIENTKKEFSFQNRDTGEVFFWPNKRWRMLSYITPDIVMTGKSYPYANDKLNIAILESLQDLAKRNLRWSYKFGPERYEDMKWINSTMSMERARGYRMLPKSHYHKKNIIFDTKGMYNDILNDHNTKYWCVRNEVDKTKIISLSGKNNCLCCNGPVTYIDYPDDQYNERYRDVGQLVCSSCEHNWFSCDGCGSSFTPGRSKLFHFHGKQYCEYCFNSFVKICPICDKPFSIIEENKLKNCRDRLYNIYLYKKSWYDEEFNFEDVDCDTLKDTVCYNVYQLDRDNIMPERRPFIPIFGHNKCIEETWGDNIIRHNVKIKPWRYAEYEESYEFNVLTPKDDPENPGKPAFPGIAKCYYLLLSNPDKKDIEADQQQVV